MDRYHVFENPPDGRECCNRWCAQCNQCKCDTGAKRLCPGFDVKANPTAFEHWKLDLEIEKLEKSIQWIPRHLPRTRSQVVMRLNELSARKNALADPEL